MNNLERQLETRSTPERAFRIGSVIFFPEAEAVGKWLADITSKYKYKERGQRTLDEPGRHRQIEEVYFRISGPDGQLIQEDSRELLKEGDGSYLIPVVESGNQNWVIMILQLRPGASKPWQIEFPAGGLSKGEKPLDNAIKELSQETGAQVDSGHIFNIGTGPVLIGRSPQETHFYLAFVNQLSQANPEKEELIFPFAVPLNQAEPLIEAVLNLPPNTNLGADPKMLAGLTLAEERLSLLTQQAEITQITKQMFTEVSAQ